MKTKKNISECLSSSDIELNYTLRKYDKSDLLESTPPTQFNREGNSSVEFSGGKWEVNLIEDISTKQKNGIYSFEVSFELSKGKALSVSPALSLSFNKWSVDNYLLIPSAAYNGNRFTSHRFAYPPLLEDPKELGLDQPTIITDVPRLNIDSGKSELHLRTGDASTPCVGVYMPETKTGLLLFTEQGSQFGDHGLHVIESDCRSRATILIDAPGMRPNAYRIGNTDCESSDFAPDWNINDRVVIRCQVMMFSAPRLQTLFDQFVACRDLTFYSKKSVPCVPYSHAWKLLEEKYNRDNWRDAGYYAVGVPPWEHYQDWQIGWTGGMILTLPLLAHGDTRSQECVLSNIEWLFEYGQSPAGLFYGIIHDGNIFSDGFSKEHADNWVMVRKNGDAIYFLIKHLMLQQRRDPDWQVPEKWLVGLRRAVQAFVDIWKKNHQIGQFIDITNNEIAVGGSLAGGIVPGALALAGQYFKNSEYIDIAGQIANYFCKNFVSKGISTGGPGEICQCPDSESAFGMLESLVTLYEVTKESSWLSWAGDMGNQCSTWCMNYDYKFPDNSLFADLKMLTNGSVWANVQNKHSAPAICTFSGDSLFKLYRATGNMSYLKLIQDIAHNLPQYLSRDDRPIKEMPSGWINERVNTSDWEGIENHGGIFVGSCWPEVSLSLTCMEIPSIYIQPDIGLVVVFDHVEVKTLNHSNGKIHIAISNNTDYTADIRVFCENSKDAVQTLPTNEISFLPIITIKSGEEIELHY